MENFQEHMGNSAEYNRKGRIKIVYKRIWQANQQLQRIEEETTELGKSIKQTRGSNNYGAESNGLKYR